MSAAVRQLLPDGRWHFQHGPIDCIVSAEGEAGAAAECIEHAWSRFCTVLEELVEELTVLRADLSSLVLQRVVPLGRVGRRMVSACRPHASEGRFITAMAAVAGSVAEEIVTSFDDPRICRASVNNGGDIALVLRGDGAFDVGVVTDPSADHRHPERSEGSRRVPAPAGRFRVEARSPVRGIATSGWRGRSFSLGIADSVTVLARTAAEADAAATMIANAVDVDDPRIVRRPASTLKDDSDLGDLLVTVDVPPLDAALVGRALDAGLARADALRDRGLITACAMVCQGALRTVGRDRLWHGPRFSPLTLEAA